MELTGIDLPLAPRLPEISALLDERRLLVLHAEPGAGKSTLVPPYLMDRPWLEGGRIIMLEPRRAAAAAVASRIAELLGEAVGARAGYRVRAASRVSPATRIEVVTEALLTRMIQNDPLLEGVRLLIFDEFHERSIHADLALALALEVRRARPELALLLMSATLERERLASFLAATTGTEPAVLQIPGRAHPVSTRHRAPPPRGHWEQGFAALVSDLIQEGDGDVLAFLPGMREIRRVAAHLAALLPAASGIEIAALHGSMPLEEQRHAIAPRPEEGAARRVILATAVAETSLTVPGVRVVADSGWTRLARFHARTGMDRLTTERVSRSSADQRRGRAGRMGPGRCVRFWPEGEPLLASPDPEIVRSDLTSLVLECAVWGATGPEGLPWLDPPPLAAWSRAVEVLRSLGFVEADGSATPAGHDAASLGLHPRLAAMVRAGARAGVGGLAAASAALIEERDDSTLRGEADFRLRLAALRRDDGGSVRRQRSVTQECRRILGLMGLTSRGWTEADEERAGDLLAHAFPDRIARGEADGLWRFPSGRVARTISGLAPLAAARGREPGEQWLVGVDVDAGETVGTIRLAAPISAEGATRALEPITRETTEVLWRALVPRAVSRRAAGRLTLLERRVPCAAEAVRDSFLGRLRTEGREILPWGDASRRLLDRLRFYASHGGELTIPAGSSLDRALLDHAGRWLQGRLDLSGGPVLTPKRLYDALSALAPRRGAVDRLAPDSVTLPTGAKRHVDYAGAEPSVEARIQEVFGLSSAPRVAGVPLTFRLLSPAGRPLQITRDLASFWRATYPEVRKEMRGRYPRHYWPENPLEAEPTSRARPRRS